MPITDWIVRAPTILPLRQGRPGETANQIYCDTSVRIETETPDCKIYFTSDGSDPDVFGETASGRDSTHRYKGPFKLRPGRRTLKAMAVTRDDHMISSVSTRTFQVMEPRPYQDFDRATALTTETELDSFTLNEIAAGKLQRYPPPRAPYTDPPPPTYTDPLQRDFSALDYPSCRDTPRDYSLSDFHTPRRSRSRSGGSLHRARSRSHSPLRTYSKDENLDLDSYFNPASIGASSMTPRNRRYEWDYGSDDNETHVSNYFQRHSSGKPYKDMFDDYPTSSRVHFGQETRHLYSKYDDTRLLHHQSNHKPQERRSSHEDELAYELGYDVLDKKQLNDDKALNEFIEKGYHGGFDLAAKHLSDTEDDWLVSPRSKSEAGSSRMSRREKHDEEKKKKKKKTDSSPSSVSSFSSLSLSGDETERKTEVKTEKKEEKSVENKEEESLVKEVEEKEEKVEEVFEVVPKQAKEKKNREGGTQTTPRSARSDLSKKSGKKGRLNFINDSGTQINFWGVESEEAVEKITSVIRGDKPKTEAKRAKTPPPPTKPKPKSVKVKKQPEAQSAVIQKEDQKDQKSIGGFFKKLFSGWGSSDKEKTDPRATVREIDGDDTNKRTFEQIVAECRNDDVLWEDPDFPTVDASIYTEESPVSGRIEWKRPHEICEDPQMFVGGASRFDIKQGVLGNCWLLAALGSLCSDNKLLRRVVPSEQTFDGAYAGVFRFRFWQYGQWVEVCIDDRLPTQNGQLIFLHSERTNEFWSPLLEKAYAKISGSYEALSGGLASEGMTDFSGGVCERFDMREDLPDNMFQIMLKAHKARSLMGCSIDAKPNEIEGVLANGLIIGHAYTISDVKTVSGLGRYIRTPDGSANLVRVRNPWGNEAEWNGAWSDKSNEWKSLPEDLKASIGLTFDHDGEFWMSFQDFSSNFQRVEICNLGPDALMDASDDDVKWSCNVLRGAWRKNTNAGGCRNFPKTYFMNPQYNLQVRDGDDDDDDNMGSVIVGLMQKGRRRLRALGKGNWTIGYDVYSKKDIKSNETLDKRFFERHSPVVSSPTYINMREICGRHKLPIGDYCIVPTTFEANEEADFVVRVFSEKEAGVTEVDTGSAVVQAQPAQVVHSAPSAKVTMNAEKLFEKYGGEDKEVDAYELGAILNATFAREFKFGEFDLNVCRSLVAVRDADRTGKLSLEEFRLTWDDLQSWKMLYKQYDQDQNGHFNAYELKEALKSLGFQVSNGTFSTLITKYSNRDGFIEFDDFVACVINVKSIFDTFHTMELCDGKVTFSLDQVLQMAVY